jgi:hypothetical protein
VARGDAGRGTTGTVVTGAEAFPATGRETRLWLPGRVVPELSSSTIRRSVTLSLTVSGTEPSIVTVNETSWFVEYERIAPLTKAVDPDAVCRAALLPSTITWIVHRASVRLVCIWRSCPRENVADPEGRIV